VGGTRAARGATEGIGAACGATEGTSAALGATNDTGAGGAPGDLLERKNKNGCLNHRVRKQGLQLKIRRRCRSGVGEFRLIKHNMSGDEHSTRGEIKATVPLVVKGVTEKHTTC
jgi:hypothetical protein